MVHPKCTCDIFTMYWAWEIKNIWQVHCEYMAKIQYFLNTFTMSQGSSMYSQCTCHVFLIFQAQYIVKMLQVHFEWTNPLVPSDIHSPFTSVCIWPHVSHADNTFLALDPMTHVNPIHWWWSSPYVLYWHSVDPEHVPYTQFPHLCVQHSHTLISYWTLAHIPPLLWYPSTPLFLAWWLYDAFNL